MQIEIECYFLFIDVSTLYLEEDWKVYKGDVSATSIGEITELCVRFSGILENTLYNLHSVVDITNNKVLSTQSYLLSTIDIIIHAPI